MTRALALAALLLAGCDLCPSNTIDTTKFVAVAQFHDAFVACANQRDCNQLCIDAFALTADDQLESCGIVKLVPAGGTVHVRYTAPQTCAADDSGADVVIVTGDDGTTDDPCSDGSCDPPPDDPCSDGSCDPPPDDPPPDDPDPSSMIRRSPAGPTSRPAR
jgi:hypothetical protein